MQRLWGVLPLVAVVIAGCLGSPQGDDDATEAVAHDDGTEAVADDDGTEAVTDGGDGGSDLESHEVCAGADHPDLGGWDVTAAGDRVTFGGIELLHPPNAEVVVPALDQQGATSWGWILHVPGEADVCAIFLAYERQVLELTGAMSLHPTLPGPVVNADILDTAPAVPDDPDEVDLVRSFYADASDLVGAQGDITGGLTPGPTPVVEVQLLVARTPLDELNMFTQLPPGTAVEIVISDLR